jgi:GH25 family lysozyme M1 (1,4-beta-N-acetylmuramidase)
MTILGIDVSRAQGHNLDWQSIAGVGIRFAMLKATQGATSKDDSFERNYEQATANRIAVGAYHWLSPQTDPKAQAAWTRTALGNRALPARLAVDFEDPGFNALGKEKALSYCETYVREVESWLGRQVLVYTGKWFWMQTVARDSELLAARPLWHAEYPSTKRGGATQADYDAAVKALPPSGPHIASPWADRNRGATMWQFDGDHGLLLPQKIDSDFNVFFGGEDAFQAFLGNDAPARPPFVPTIANIQQVLLDAGLDIGAPDGKPDGVAGPKTKQAIRQFQAAHGLVVDGIVGPKTLAALAAAWTEGASTNGPG